MMNKPMKTRISEALRWINLVLLIVVTLAYQYTLRQQQKLIQDMLWAVQTSQAQAAACTGILKKTELVLVPSK
jgi:hypothetical protein